MLQSKQMKVILIVAAAGFCAPPVPARADGMMISPEQARKRRERNLINEPDQKALVFFSKGKEQLVISPGFREAPDRFAWIIPVPSKPVVAVVEGAIFHELARLAERPRPMMPSPGMKAGNPSARVTVIE